MSAYEKLDADVVVLDPGETEVKDGPLQLGGSQIGEGKEPGGIENQSDVVSRVEKGADLRAGFLERAGSLAAVDDAVSTPDAALIGDLRLSLLDVDGVDGTGTDAGIGFLAPFSRRGDDRHRALLSPEDPPS